jgi:hypothetical protein
VEYQKLNFISTDDVDNYKKKVELKKSLIELSDSEDKQNLLITTLYDFKDLVNNKQFGELESVTSILSNNSDILVNLDIKLENYIDPNIMENLKIPEELKKEFENSFNNIKKTLNLENINLDNNALFDSAKKSLNDVKQNLNNI